MLNSRAAGVTAAVVIGLLTVASCGSPTRVDDLAIAKARWAANGAAAYVIESRIRCFCPGHLAVWTRLSIRDDRVDTVEPLEPLPPGAIASASGWHTVPQLFELIERRGNDDAVSSLTVRYHPNLGYPEQITVTCRPTVIDCGATYELRNLLRSGGPIVTAPGMR